jgi:hypothetical protein
VLLLIVAALGQAQEVSISSTLAARLSAIEQPRQLKLGPAAVAPVASALAADAGAGQAVEDGRFQLAIGAFITAAGADIAVSMYQIGRGTAREQGFGAWWQDQPVPFALTKSALVALFAYQLQKIHRTRPKTAYILALVGTGIEAALVVRSARLSGPPTR